MHGSSNCDPTLIGQRGDYEPRSWPDVLVTILNQSIDLPYHEIIFLDIVSQLLLPQKIQTALNLLVVEFLLDISGMDILSDKRNQRLPLYLV